ncbi:MAG: 3-oxoacyl-ACP reductase FabG [Ktedonobacteraceae bacterium]
MDFKGKVVLVTGASRGLGKVIAQNFARQGAKVVLVARHTAPLEALEDEILAAGGEAITVSADISDPSAVQAMAIEVGITYGRVDIIINNAAVAILKPMTEVSREEWQEMTGVNLHGMFLVTQTFLPGMIERKSGVVVNISAALARNGYPNLAVYSATKAGIIAFSEALSKEVRRHGVQVYTVCPHGINTDLYKTLFGATDPAKILAPERVAQDVLRVAAGEGGIRSGQTLEISVEAVR